MGIIKKNENNNNNNYNYNIYITLMYKIINFMYCIINCKNIILY